MKLSSPKLKKVLTFQEGACKALKSKISHFLVVERELFKHNGKTKNFLCFPL